MHAGTRRTCKLYKESLEPAGRFDFLADSLNHRTTPSQIYLLIIGGAGYFTAPFWPALTVEDNNHWENSWNILVCENKPPDFNPAEVETLQ